MNNFLKTKIIFQIRSLKAKTIIPLNLFEWKQRNFSSPLPVFIKRNYILSFSDPSMAWLETGTYKGDTTYQLSKKSKHVISIEPMTHLYRNASKRLIGAPNVTLLFGTSEARFRDALSLMRGNVGFFLDGHSSGGETYTGPQISPLKFELEQISKKLSNFEKVTILIDDVRLFETDDYPSLSYVINWANVNNLSWNIENDIFIARTKVKN